jgi:hypothetical protein
VSNSVIQPTMIARPSFRSEWQVSTLDITIAVLLGVVTAAIVVGGALDYVSRIFQSIGVVGIVGSFIIVSVTGALVATAGYLRQKILVMILAALVIALIRWFTGDPDGAFLFLYWPAGAVLGGLILWAFRWRDTWWLYGIVGAVMAGTSIGIWGVLFGVQVMGMNDFVTGFLTVVVAGFFTCGVLSLLIGHALQRAGISVQNRQAT